MKKSLTWIFALAFLFSSSSLIAQVSVNPVTGTANVVIPIYTLSSGNVSVPMSLVYSAVGVKPKDVEGTAGMGWQLVAGGQINRQLHGEPDDESYDNHSVGASGWITSVTARYINGFSIANNGSNCTYETSDINYITSYLNQAYSDTEPDMFYVNAPGLSCQLVYNRDSSKFVPITNQDLVITYTTIGGSGITGSLINSFTITNDQGVKYVFASPEYVTEKDTLGSGAKYFTTRYLQYQNGVTYADSWNLTSITDANGNGIQLTYNTALVRNSVNPVLLYIGGSSTASLQYNIQQAVTPQVLNTISTFNANTTTPAFTFTWTPLNGNQDSHQTIINTITGMGRSFKFNYNFLTYTLTGFSRGFLGNFSDQGCSSPTNYNFSYLGQTVSNTIALPDSTSKQNDYWGYYTTLADTGNLIPSVYVNPSNGAYQRYAIKTTTAGSDYTYTLSHSNRAADATVIATGTLNKIVSSQGGNTNLIYEPNDYIDVPSGNYTQGGGIRIKQIIDSVGSGSTNNIIRNYYYTTSLGVTTGKPISLPAYAFTIPIGGSLNSSGQVTSATALSAYDLSNEDHTIMYTNVKVVQTGAGYTTYQYYVPATNWDANAHPACNGCTTNDWAPTIDYSARVYCSTQTVKNDIYSYPFISNPNYDFERGLLQNVTNYNDSGVEVSETNYTYQRSFAPSIITGFKVDDNNTIIYSTKGYDKYTIYYNTSELPNTVNTKVFASSGSGQVQSSTVYYYFNSTKHKLLTKQTAVNSDNSTVTTNFSYVKDYSALSGSNPNVNALYYLKQENINAPVETYQQITRSGTTVTTGASLTLFKGFTYSGTTLYLPSQQLKMVQPNGASFTPYAVSGSAQTSVYDGKYHGVANYDTYDNGGHLQTVDDSNKNIKTFVTDYITNQPTAVFKNAASGEVAFNDFDSHFSPSAQTFTITGTGSYTPVGSHAGNAAGLYATTQTATSGTLTKNPIAANYIFSIWINAATSGTLTLTLSGISTHPTISYSGGWKYYEIKIPVGTLSSSYTVSFTSSQSISIDDILFYPDVAEAATVTYDPTTHFKIAATNTNGVSAYYKYDIWGRLLYAYDQDHNILKKDGYVTQGDAQSFGTGVIQGTTGTITTNTLVTLSTNQPNTCVASNNTYKWDFGDGSPPVTTTTATAPVHRYNTAGTDTVKLTINSYLFGQIKSKAVVTVTTGPNTNLSYSNYTTSHGNIATVQFYNGATLLYTFTAAQLPTANVPKANYTIKITMAAGSQAYNSGTDAGYGGLLETGCASASCQAYSSTNVYTFNLDLSSCVNLNFAVYKLNQCN